MAKFPRGGGSGQYDRARNADRSSGHVMVVRISGFPLTAWNQGCPLVLVRASLQLRSPSKRGRHIFGVRMARTMSAAHFEPVAWWYAREEIGRGLREHYGPANDLPPRLQLLVKELDKPRSTSRSTWLARLCVLAFIAAIAAASLRFHFVF